MRSNAESSRSLEIEIMTDGSGRLTGTVARELTNLLLVIRRCAAFLRASLAANDPRQQGVDEILAAAEQATSLAARLHAFSRSRVSRMAVTAQPDVPQDARMTSRPARATQEFRPSEISTIDLRAD